MANHTPAETTEWVAGNPRKAEHVTTVEVLSDLVLRVSRDKYAPYVAGIVSVKCVKADLIEPILECKLGVDIITNVPKESYWTGGALRLAHDNNIATGSYGDLLRVIDVQDVRT